MSSSDIAERLRKTYIEKTEQVDAAFNDLTIYVIKNYAALNVSASSEVSELDALSKSSSEFLNDVANIVSLGNLKATLKCVSPAKENVANVTDKNSEYLL